MLSDNSGFDPNLLPSSELFEQYQYSRGIRPIIVIAHNWFQPLLPVSWRRLALTARTGIITKTSRATEGSHCSEVVKTEIANANKKYARWKNQHSLLLALPLNFAYFLKSTVFIAVMKFIIFLFAYLFKTYHNRYVAI